MAQDRNYTQATRAALVAFANGYCLFPDCPEPVMRKVDDSWYLNLEIAHIRGLNPGSARHDKNLASPNDYSNVLLLCHTHHKAVDRNPSAYTVARLSRWKAEREDETVRRFFGGASGGLTENLIEHAGAEGVRIRTEELDSVVKRLEEIHPQLAADVRQLAESTDMLSASRLVDSSLIEEFTTAVSQLVNLSSVLEEFSAGARTFRDYA